MAETPYPAARAVCVRPSQRPPTRLRPRCGARPSSSLLRRARRTPAARGCRGPRAKRARRVREQLALRDGRRATAEVDYAGRKWLARYLKRGARARRRLEEEVDNGATAQRRHFFYLALGDFAERLRGVEYVRYLFGAQ